MLSVLHGNHRIGEQRVHRVGSRRQHVGKALVIGPEPKKYKVKTAFGTDLLFDAKLAEKQGKFLSQLKKWYTPYGALQMATHDNAQLLKLSGPRDPYPGELGVVKEGALADLILVDGNPLQHLGLVASADKNFVVIVKDGRIYKNALR